MQPLSGLARERMRYKCCSHVISHILSDVSKTQPIALSVTIKHVRHSSKATASLTVVAKFELCVVYSSRLTRAAKTMVTMATANEEAALEQKLFV
jgi:hypothetical protein